MLTANLWVDVSLVKGAMGIVVAICYTSGQCPPHLPVAVMDSYSGPTLPDGTFLYTRSAALGPHQEASVHGCKGVTGMGCHHPQGTGYDTGQGCH